jgi:thiosulfate/3-mercaptopyruvate sulfurtransferase
VTNISPLISAAELHGIMNKADIKILDASYGLPDMPVRIGRAVAFDIDAVADPAAALPHTLPDADTFAAHVSRMGISNSDTVIVYDRGGMHMAAARAWWMFRAFGHDNVRVLDGGLPSWVEGQFPLTPVDENDEIIPATFTAQFRPALFKTLDDMRTNLDSGAFSVIDARDPRRYSGDAPEPRPGMDGGHIPGSTNLFFAHLIDPDTGLFRKNTELAQIIGLSGADTSKPIAVSCGSGVTACVVALGLHLTGRPDAAIYGGSWSEWGADPALPKTKGNAP